ncbi:hypothetical protein M011DRAFT_476664 [Sporormia fimetaria CBS 119925]|uniref:F-box domain-containing protein n=1 Tax=Sporormia fimetaria CBS 119925 TaxID=1340428 RepID=A0A6A6VBV4_9PLEO|nr:hypothetical protein M011DRAFT_476664 [Sporormia fimetaria CBS 119925]
MATTQVPDDILHLICEELAAQEQFDTLFNCACASSSFAVPALTHLYRIHHLAPVRGGGDDDSILMATKHLMVQKWSVMWRSLILSSRGKTLFPYCRYIKALDLRDLEQLLDDDQFRGKISKFFFSGPMASFHILSQQPLHQTRSYAARRVERVMVLGVIAAFGEVMTQHTPLLESISGRLAPDALPQWATRLPRLQALELYDGSPLEHDELHIAISEHCPNFNSLSIYTWSAEDRDHKLAQFLGSLRPQTLRMFETIRDIGAGAETFLALSMHGQSLKDLRLCVSADTVPQLSLLGGCTGLEQLRIEDINGITNLEANHNDVYQETIQWLQNCKSLHTLSFTRFQSAAALMTPLLLSEDIRLQRLEIDAYVLKDSEVFHRALPQQSSTLRFLSLSGDTEGMFRDDVDLLVESLSRLTKLRTLRIVLVPEFLHDKHLISVLDNLTNLEDIYLTGLEIKDGVFKPISRLKNLRSVAFSGISKFTKAGLMEFVSQLAPSCQGVRIMVDMADPDTLLSENQIDEVRERLAERLGGTLEYTPWRDPDVSEFEGDSD